MKPKESFSRKRKRVCKLGETYTESIHVVPKKIRKTQQLYLDFEGCETGIRKCEICGMTYTVGTEDERIHERIHKQAISPMKITSLKKELESVWNDETGDVYRITFDWLFVESKPTNKCRQDVLKVYDGLCKSLGLSEQDKTESKDKVLFVYIDKTTSNVLGSVIAEPKQYAFEMNESGDVDKTLKIPTTIGIQAIYVHPQYRRKSIATKLINVVLLHFFYGVSVFVDSIAFCQPTEEGMKLFQKITGKDSLLVY